MFGFDGADTGVFDTTAEDPRVCMSDVSRIVDLMDTRDIRTKLHETIIQLDDGSSGVWDYALQYGSIAGRALQDMLLRALLLTGNEDVLLADGTLEDKNGPEGYAVLITRDHIIHATFRGFDGQKLTTVVESVPVSAVQRVAADDARLSSDEDGNWPRFARVTLHLDRDVAGAREITIPRSTVRSAPRVTAIAALATRLPLA